MRYLAFLWAFFTGMSLYAQQQQSRLNLDATAEPYHFLHDNAYFEDTLLVKIKDSVSRLQAAALAAGNDELVGSLMLLIYEKESKERLVGADTTEYRLLRLATEAHEKNLKRLEADALQALADQYKDNKDQQSAALEQYIAANALYRNFSYTVFPDKQYYTYDLGLMLLKYQDYSNALLYLLQALHTETGTTYNRACAIATAIGLVYRNTEQYDSAIRYFQIAYDSAIKQKQDIWLGISEGNIGICYFYKNEYSKAEPLLKKDIESSLTNSNIRNAVNSMAVLSKIYCTQGKYDEAERLLLKATSLSYSKSFWHDYSLSKRIYEQLYIVYGKKKLYRLSYLYCDSALNASDSAVSQTNAAAITKAYEKQNYVKKKLAEEKLQSENRIKKIVGDKQHIVQQQLLYKFNCLSALGEWFFRGYYVVERHWSCYHCLLNHPIE